MPEPGFEILPPEPPGRPLVVHVPHAGTRIPSDVRTGLVLDEAGLVEELRRMTDHRTDVLAAGTAAVGATRFVNRLSRLVVDPERFLDPDLEEMEEVGMGAVYTATSGRAVLRRPDPAERERLLDAWFRPYHAAFTALLGRHLDTYGRVVVVDVHSYPSVALPYERHAAAARPPLCVGTHPVHTPSAVRDVVADLAAGAGLEVAFDAPFAGTFVPTSHLDDRRVVSVMLEIRRDTYLDETTATPHDGESRIAAFVTDVADALGDLGGVAATTRR
ncbi:MAG: N-formylglutamate amidohydrolase [Actinobacteria bacterium]|jgi:N-formylglutamate amidohydrolase|nr:N-formylglutamate amidohydrolase [Actinomycetota bacterium]